ncbi:MAG: hypothetical protein QMD85_02475 [Candidatus Aenigmarchaeota archaeon]|nr:hypothetical protein [Candidatus Aenigmarchaeota archaeon]
MEKKEEKVKKKFEIYIPDAARYKNIMPKPKYTRAAYEPLEALNYLLRGHHCVYFEEELTIYWIDNPEMIVDTEIAVHDRALEKRRSTWRAKNPHYEERRRKKTAKQIIKEIRNAQTDPWEYAMKKCEETGDWTRFHEHLTKRDDYPQ